MRVYVPATLTRLREYAASGVVPGSNEYFPASDESEDAEYEAFEVAVDEAGELLRALEDGRGRRVVIAVEGVPAADDGVADIPFADILAVHADTSAVSADDPDLPDLAWFATQEIEELLASR